MLIYCVRLGHALYSINYGKCYCITFLGILSTSLFVFVSAAGCDGYVPYGVCQCRPVAGLPHPPAQVRCWLQTLLHHTWLRVQTLHNKNTSPVSTTITFLDLKTLMLLHTIFQCKSKFIKCIHKIYAPINFWIESLWDYHNIVCVCDSVTFSSLVGLRWSWVWQIPSLPELWSTGLTLFDWQTSPTPARRPMPLPLRPEVGGVGRPGTARTPSLGYRQSISRFSIGTRCSLELSPPARWEYTIILVHKFPKPSCLLNLIKIVQEFLSYTKLCTCIHSHTLLTECPWK